MRKSKFNLTHDHSTTLDAGFLVPFLLLDCLPNDSYRISISSFIRAQPMVAPLMHRVFFYTQYWFVPYRILWNNWEEFITGGEDLDKTPAYPTIKAPEGGFVSGSLADYFGFPVGQDGIEVSALPFRAYNEIWNSRYRDEDIQSEKLVVYSSGPDEVTETNLLSPSWKRDYFTTARPSTQRGSEVTIPVYSRQSEGGIHRHIFNVSVILCDAEYVNEYAVNLAKNNEIYFETPTDEATFLISATSGRSYKSLAEMKPYENSNGVTGFPERNLLVSIMHDALSQIRNANPVPTATENTLPQWKYIQVSGRIVAGVVPVNVDYNVPVLVRYYWSSDTVVPSQGFDTAISTLFSDNSWNSYDYIRNDDSDGYYYTFWRPTQQYTQYVNTSSTAYINVKDLRLSSALQRYQERSLEWGNRYEEFIQREFGIKPRDSRIQRPEYLGGGKSILNISEVLQTAEATDTYVGTMRGHGVAAAVTRPIRFKCPEHGCIIGLLSIRPQPVYTQGINRAWLKRTRLDFFTPELANIGMQEVFTQELFANNENGQMIFGFQNRYDEYRFHPPRVTGQFRTSELNYWNMARNFSQPPVLNSSFINMADSSAVFKRPFAEQTQHSYLAMLVNRVRAWRPIPKRAKNILK